VQHVAAGARQLVRHRLDRDDAMLARLFAQTRRVLRPGGTLLFNVGDRIGTNDFA
jgi:SAM-dependent methyltransferase